MLKMFTALSVIMNTHVNAMIKQPALYGATRLWDSRAQIKTRNAPTSHIADALHDL